MGRASYLRIWPSIAASAEGSACISIYGYGGRMVSFVRLKLPSTQATFPWHWLWSRTQACIGSWWNLGYHTPRCDMHCGLHMATDYPSCYSYFWDIVWVVQKGVTSCLQLHPVLILGLSMHVQFAVISHRIADWNPTFFVIACCNICSSKFLFLCCRG